MAELVVFGVSTQRKVSSTIVKTAAIVTPGKVIHVSTVFIK